LIEFALAAKEAGADRFRYCDTLGFDSLRTIYDRITRLAAAVGIRPFLPALAVGVLAAGKVEINFDGTKFSFLESLPFLLAMVVAVIVLALIERRAATAPAPKSPLSLLLAAAGLVLGALLFAGSLARGHYAVWPGLIGGVVCAAIAVAATRPLLARVHGRLDKETAGTLPVYTEVAALGVGALSVLAPPVGVIALLLLLWLLVAGRARGEQKYAGLRILR